MSDDAFSRLRARGAPDDAGTGAAPATAPADVRRAPGPDRARSAARRRLGSVVAAGIGVALVAVAATALAGVVTARVADRNAVDQARDAAVGAAVGNVATVLSYDYRHLDQDFAAADRLLSPKFRKKYDSTTAKGVRPLAVRYKTITTADVSAAGVIDVSANRALVLVFVNQTSTNTQLAAPRLDRSRIRVSLVRTGGHWLIDDLQPI